LDPGERLEIDWRVRIDSVLGGFDPAVTLGAGAHGVVFLNYGEDAIYSAFEGVWIPFAPGLFHEYSLISTDLLTYSLYVDGQPAHTGYLVGPWSQSAVCWGDTVEGASSISTWDWVRFGVVPEPPTGFALGFACLWGICVRPRTTRRNLR
jgi:hypothetical protein